MHSFRQSDAKCRANESFVFNDSSRTVNINIPFEIQMAGRRSKKNLIERGMDGKPVKALKRGIVRHRGPINFSSAREIAYFRRVAVHKPLRGLGG